MENKRIFIKGFDKDLKCRGFQFEIGKEYKIENNGKELELCTDTVFHFCDSLSKVHVYYSCNEENNRFCIIEALGEIVEDEDKIGSDHIRVVREITGEELKIAKGLTGGNAGLFNSSDGNVGDRNTGDRNTGNWNTGVFNKTNCSNGVFCNIEPKICIFNIQTDWTLQEFYNSKYWYAICSSDFNLTEWEEFDNPAESGVDGKLIVNSYEDACKKWWANMDKENKDIIKSMPNFNIDVFCDITGIDEKDV